MLTIPACAHACPMVDHLIAGLAVQNGRTRPQERQVRLGPPARPRPREPRTRRQQRPTMPVDMFDRLRPRGTLMEPSVENDPHEGGVV